MAVLLMIPQKLNVKPPYNSRTLRGRWPKEYKVRVQADMFTTVVFMTAKHEPTQLPINGSVLTPRFISRWMTNKMWYGHMPECYSVVKRKGLWHLAQHTWILKLFVQSQKSKYCVSLLLWGTQTIYTHRTRKENWGCHRHGVQVKVVSVYWWEKVLEFCCIILWKF